MLEYSRPQFCVDGRLVLGRLITSCDLAAGTARWLGVARGGIFGKLCAFDSRRCAYALPRRGDGVTAVGGRLLA